MIRTGCRTRSSSGKEGNPLGLAHAANWREGIVGRNVRLAEHAARDDARAERDFPRGLGSSRCRRRCNGRPQSDLNLGLDSGPDRLRTCGDDLGRDRRGSATGAASTAVSKISKGSQYRGADISAAISRASASVIGLGGGLIDDLGHLRDRRRGFKGRLATARRSKTGLSESDRFVGASIAAQGGSGSTASAFTSGTGSGSAERGRAHPHLRFRRLAECRRWLRIPRIAPADRQRLHRPRSAASPTRYVPCWSRWRPPANRGCRRCGCQRRSPGTPADFPDDSNTFPNRREMLLQRHAVERRGCSRLRCADCLPDRRQRLGQLHRRPPASARRCFHLDRATASKHHAGVGIAVARHIRRGTSGRARSP